MCSVREMFVYLFLPSVSHFPCCHHRSIYK